MKNEKKMKKKNNKTNKQQTTKRGTILKIKFFLKNVALLYKRYLIVSNTQHRVFVMKDINYSNVVKTTFTKTTNLKFSFIDT